MGSSPSAPLSPELLTALTAVAGEDGFIGFDQFMEIALYHPTVGYYRRDRDRVGLSSSTDFFTASSLGPVFGELVVACCVSNLHGGSPGDFQFIEIGAESGKTVFDEVDHPFAGITAIGHSESPDISGRCIVFSNELFDAQPCRRFVKSESGWDELGAKLEGDGLVDAIRPLSGNVAELPTSAPLGYHLDLPIAARNLATSLTRSDWTGLFLAFDYGKSWTELITETPHGTLRAYHQHRQSNALLDRVGEQDLTCHICWDWLQEALQKKGFSVDSIAFQEAFLVKNAANALAKIMAEEAAHVSARKSGLLQLLHPSALGQKFQVLSAWRDDF